MSIKQVTLKGEFSIQGVGLHTGKEVNVTFKPAAINTGYNIVRVDVDGSPMIPAIAKYVEFVDRASCLRKDGLSIYTLEHAMSALYASGIDNCIMEINGEEFPIIDGSAKVYVEQIANVGTEEQDAERRFFEVKQKLEYVCEETKSKITLLPDEDYVINAMISFDSPYISMQYATYDSTTNYATEISPCRTFVFLREVEYLLSNNLIKGGDLSNAIVIVDRKISQSELDRLADLFGCERVEVKEGVLNTLDLQFDNEPARHKLLDIIGDLALCGRFIKGRVIAERTGHKVNTSMAKLIYQEIIKNEKPDAYPENINPFTVKPLMDINKIRSLLPHRPPFLLVDKILEISSDMIIGCKNVTMNEPHFVGHFPEEPVMPGVLMVEAMAQCGGLMVLNSVPDPENYSTYFMKIDGIKFRQKVVPGDTLVFKLVTISPIRRGIVSMKGYAYVDKKIVCEGEFMAQVVKTKNL